jgi:uncharacterized protein YlxW (UPF0749 family)
MAVLGFLLALQVKAHEGSNQQLDTKSMDELTTLVGALTQENQRLLEEVTELELLVLDSQYAGQTDETLIAQQQDNLRALQLATGRAAAYGRGISVRLEDRNGELKAYDLCQIANELKSAGAEAVLVNDRRLDFRASFSDEGGRVLLSGEPLTRPYHFLAVGNPADLESSLVMAGGVVPSLDGLPGVFVEVARQQRVDAPPVMEEPTFVYAARGEQ